VGLRDDAAADFADILREEDGMGTPFVLIDANGVEHPVRGMVGDIALMIEPLSGVRVRSRSIEAVIAASEETGGVPARGWRARLTDLRGETVECFVQGCDPDRTLGAWRLELGLSIEDDDESADAGD